MAKKEEIKKEELVTVTPLINIGSERGKVKYPKGKPCKVTTEQRDNWKLNKIIK